MNHEERSRMQDKFMDYWNAELSHLFEFPGRKQTLTWLLLCGFDFSLLEASIADLQSRARSPFNENDPYVHMLKHFSATLIRKTKNKYGRVRPQIQEAA